MGKYCHGYNNCCFIAGNFFQTAQALIGYFDVTWQLTMKLFLTKIKIYDIKG